MPAPDQPSPTANSSANPVVTAAKAVIVGSVAFTFITYWQTAAVVLCDLASTAYYIGGIVEQSIGPAAPWFILAVMLFSYAVRSVYIESCSLFVRGGVYRVVKEAMGGFVAKLSVSALMFDFILTGPTSGVSAGQYIMGLGMDGMAIMTPGLHAHLGFQNAAVRDFVKRWGSVVIAIIITLYFFRQNVIGIHESSAKAVKIMIATTGMAIVIVTWCAITLVVRGPVNKIPLWPDLNKKPEYKTVIAVDRINGGSREIWKLDDFGQPLAATDAANKAVPKINEATGEQEDPLGFFDRLFPSLAKRIRRPGGAFSLIGLMGLFIAFGHSILAMSGEETLAQVYREVEAPKLLNFKKAAFIVFAYSLLLTAVISFLAVLLIPNEIRMKEYSDNLIGGLAMYVIGPATARLFLNALVVGVGFLILAGAVNTAIIGSNGVLNRLSEDGVMPDWFLRPHPRFGTTYRVLWLIVIMQVLVIVISRGQMYVLGEAYAFGVVWSFVFKSLGMVVLRFTDKSPREFKVPWNPVIRGVEIPMGLICIFLVLLITALCNLFTKEVATAGGVIFTAGFLTVFSISEWLHNRGTDGKHEHVEQFNQEIAPEVSSAAMRLTKPHRKLVSIRSVVNLFMLEKSLEDTDPATTDVIVMTAKVTRPSVTDGRDIELDRYDRQLMTAVVTHAERVGKKVIPLIIPTNNAAYAIVRTAKDLKVQEIVIGESNRISADQQLEQISQEWDQGLQFGEPAQPVTVRILGRTRDIHYDLHGGNRIPTFSERHAHTVAELRAGGVGVDRVLMIHDESQYSSDLFYALLTMLDPAVALGLTRAPATRRKVPDGMSTLSRDEERAQRLRRRVQLHSGETNIAKLAKSNGYDMIVIPLPNEWDGPMEEWVITVLRTSHCPVFLAAPATIPDVVSEDIA